MANFNNSLKENLGDFNHAKPLWKNPNPSAKLLDLLVCHSKLSPKKGEPKVLRVLKGAGCVLAGFPLGVLCLVEAITKLALAIITLPLECCRIELFRNLVISVVHNAVGGLALPLVAGSVVEYAKHCKKVDATGCVEKISF